MKNDAGMGNAIYSVVQDKNFTEKAELGESRFTKIKGRKWAEDITKMTEALAREWFKHSFIQVCSPKRVTGMGELVGSTSGVSLDMAENDVDGLPWDFENPAKRANAEQLV